MEQTLTFEKLPEAVSQLNKKLDNIEQLLLEGGNKSTPQDELLTVPQAADFLSLAIPTVYTMTSRGELPFMKRSKRIYFSRFELMDYLKKGRQKTTQEIEAEADQFLSKN